MFKFSLVMAFSVLVLATLGTSVKTRLGDSQSQVKNTLSTAGVSEWGKSYDEFANLSTTFGMKDVPSVSELLNHDVGKEKQLYQQLNTLCHEKDRLYPFKVKTNAGHGVFFLPCRTGEEPLTSAAFFDSESLTAIYVMPWYAVMSFPVIFKSLVERNPTISKTSVALYLLPRYSNYGTYNSQQLPNRYRTIVGSTEIKYVGNTKKGDVEYKIFLQRLDGKLEELVASGTISIELLD